MDLSILNTKQQEAVTAPMGPVLVLAGAGSGKTRVLTYRIAYLIEQGLVAPEQILALTFTNKAAKEVQERVHALLGTRTGLASPTLGTFHSVCARILRKEIYVLGYAPGFTIFDADDQLKIIREICSQLDLGKKFSPTLFRAYISAAKNVMQTPETFGLGLEQPLHDIALNVYTRYQNFLHQQNGVDFDDLLLLVIKIWQGRPEILARYQQRFQYILVDEYQDTNPAQYTLLRLLTPRGNVFVVGDDAQSIYGFRGSTIANILNFETDYPHAVVVTLEQNYRSTKNILAVADTVIALNSEQKPKKLWTNNPAGALVCLQEVDHERAEAEFVAKKIIHLSTGQEEAEVAYEPEPESATGGFSILDQFLKKQSRHSRSGSGFFSSLPQLPRQHQSLNDYVVVYRTHAQSRALEEVFIQCGIPYQIVGGLKFYERKEIKDMLAYARLTVNIRDLVSLKRVINEPARGIGEKSYQVIRDVLVEHFESRRSWQTEADALDATTLIAEVRSIMESIRLPAKQYQAVQQFFLLIESFHLFPAEQTLLELFQLIFKKSGLSAWLDDGTEMGRLRIDNVQELLNVVAKYGTASWHEALPTFLEEIALITEIDSADTGKDAVTLMTLHSAKGLEFATVFFVGLEEGIMPHSRSLLNPSELAEEIRLAYVGMTRAKQRLFLLYARSRTVFGNPQHNIPSRILRILPEQYIQGTIPKHTFMEFSGELQYEPIEN
jgi:DNA helicase II / ATP-dependent DNA helicase PcrA